MSSDKSARELTVDGERFRLHHGVDGTTHCDWLSGPNPGYGLSIGPAIEFVPDGSVAPTAPVDDEQRIVGVIRDFLANINPDTGYLD